MLIPLTTGERGLILHHKLFPRDTGFNLAGLLKITGKIDPNRLAACVERILNSLDAFQSSFVDVGGETFRNVDPSRETHVDVIERHEGEGLDAFRDRVAADASMLQNTSLCADQWPLFTCRIYVEHSECAYMLHSAPHLISDGYSVAMCYEAISALYNSDNWESFDLGSIVINPAPACDDGRTVRASERSDAFYRELLETVPTLEMPSVVQARDAQDGITGRIIRIAIPRNRLDPALAKQGIPAARAFLTAYMAMLRQLLPTDRLVLGFAVPNRTAQNRRAVGCFVNTVPLIVDTDFDQSLDDLDRDIGARLFRLHRHQGFVAGNHSASPRFTCLYTAYPGELILELDQCECVAVPIERRHMPGEIRLTVEIGTNEYRLVFDLGQYFDHIDVEGTYREVLAALSADKTIPMTDIPIAGSRLEDPQRLRSLAGRIDKLNGGVGEVFAQIAANRPDATAITFADAQLSYGELDRLANRLARVLLDAASEADEIVVAVDRDHYAVALVLAILKAGKCYVPIDGGLPEHRRQAILDELDRAFIVGPSHVRGAAPGMDFAQLLAAARSQPADGPMLQLDADRPAYMIHTSGSTGTPKGVALSHRNLASLIFSGAAEFGFDERDTWTLFHSFSFDFSIWEMFGCLLTGGRLVVIDALATKDIHRFCSILERERITVLNHTPAVFRHIVREERVSGKTIAPRVVFLGGEALNFSTLQEWEDQHPLESCQLINLYGPTEATVLVTFHRLRKADLAGKRSIIGQPIASAIIEVRDPAGALVPVGVPGEVTIFGLGIARNGYFKRSADTRDRFFSGKDGVGFRTGDYGRIGADGLLDYLGRMDRQIKVRGFRIEPGDVENALMKCTFVRECAVGLRVGDEPADAVLAAYVVPASPDCTEQKVREELRSRLPAYMVPGTIGIVDHIPTTISGKTDFEALAATVSKPTDSIPKSKRTGSAVEMWLAERVAEKLGSEGFSVTDNLLDIGLNSLAAVDLVGAIRERFGEEAFSVTDIFECSTVSSIAERLENTAPAESSRHVGRMRAKQRTAGMQRRRRSRPAPPEARQL